jgi:hypothetical protein
MTLKSGIEIAYEKDCIGLPKLCKEPNGAPSLCSDSFNSIYKDWHQN